MYGKSIGTEWIHILWPMKFCPKADADLFSQNCKPLQGNSISSDHQNNILVSSMSGDIILDCQIKTHDGWVARIEFIQETQDKRAQSVMAPCNKNINDLHVELRHPSKTISHATAKALNIQVTGTFKPCEDFNLGKAKQ